MTPIFTLTLDVTDPFESVDLWNTLTDHLQQSGSALHWNGLSLDAPAIAPDALETDDHSASDSVRYPDGIDASHSVLQLCRMDETDRSRLEEEESRLDFQDPSWFAFASSLPSPHPVNHDLSGIVTDGFVDDPFYKTAADTDPGEDLRPGYVLIFARSPYEKPLEIVLPECMPAIDGLILFVLFLSLLLEEDRFLSFNEGRLQYASEPILDLSGSRLWNLDKYNQSHSDLRAQKLELDEKTRDLNRDIKIMTHGKLAASHLDVHDLPIQVLAKGQALLHADADYHDLDQQLLMAEQDRWECIEEMFITGRVLENSRRARLKLLFLLLGRMSAGDEMAFHLFYLLSAGMNDKAIGLLVMETAADQDADADLMSAPIGQPSYSEGERLMFLYELLLMLESQQIPADQDLGAIQEIATDLMETPDWIPQEEELHTLMTLSRELLTCAVSFKLQATLFAPFFSALWKVGSRVGGAYEFLCHLLSFACLYTWSAPADELALHDPVEVGECARSLLKTMTTQTDLASLLQNDLTGTVLALSAIQNVDDESTHGELMVCTSQLIDSLIEFWSPTTPLPGGADSALDHFMSGLFEHYWNEPEGPDNLDRLRLWIEERSKTFGWRSEEQFRLACHTWLLLHPVGWEEEALHHVLSLLRQVESDLGRRAAETMIISLGSILPTGSPDEWPSFNVMKDPRPELFLWSMRKILFCLSDPQIEDIAGTLLEGGHLLVAWGCRHVPFELADRLWRIFEHVLDDPIFDEFDALSKLEDLRAFELEAGHPLDVMETNELIFGPDFAFMAGVLNELRHLHLELLDATIREQENRYEQADTLFSLMRRCWALLEKAWIFREEELDDVLHGMLLVADLLVQLDLPLQALACVEHIEELLDDAQSAFGETFTYRMRSLQVMVTHVQALDAAKKIPAEERLVLSLANGHFPGYKDIPDDVLIYGKAVGTLAYAKTFKDDDALELLYKLVDEIDDYFEEGKQKAKGENKEYRRPPHIEIMLMRMCRQGAILAHKYKIDELLNFFINTLHETLEATSVEDVWVYYNFIIHTYLTSDPEDGIDEDMDAVSCMWLERFLSGEIPDVKDNPLAYQCLMIQSALHSRTIAGPQARYRNLYQKFMEQSGQTIDTGILNVLIGAIDDLREMPGISINLRDETVSPFFQSEQPDWEQAWQSDLIALSALDDAIDSCEDIDDLVKLEPQIKEARKRLENIESNLKLPLSGMKWRYHLLHLLTQQKSQDQNQSTSSKPLFNQCRDYLDAERKVWKKDHSFGTHSNWGTALIAASAGIDVLQAIARGDYETAANYWCVFSVRFEDFHCSIPVHLFDAFRLLSLRLLLPLLEEDRKNQSRVYEDISQVLMIIITLRDFGAFPLDEDWETLQSPVVFCDLLITQALEILRKYRTACYPVSKKYLQQWRRHVRLMAIKRPF